MLAIPTTINWRLIVFLLLFSGAGLAGYYTGKGQREVQVVEKVGETRTEWRNRIVTVTRVVRPDGTTEESTSTKEGEGNTERKSTSQSTQTRPVLSSYSLGVSYWSSYSDLLRDVSTFELGRVELGFGRRLVGELWLEVGIRRHEFSLGVSAKF